VFNQTLATAALAAVRHRDQVPLADRKKLGFHEVIGVLGGIEGPLAFAVEI
jgi:hypothetical protein